ncbi:hypothetical protein GCM10010206_35060 [Streptomyces cinerochromogenes]|nr:hypothetical protein GCM10010206_35060 [Streptomyces cinerochromogenes]
MRAIENRSQQRFPEALGAVRAPFGRHPLTRHDPHVPVAEGLDDEEISRAIAPPGDVDDRSGRPVTWARRHQALT